MAELNLGDIISKFKAMITAYQLRKKKADPLEKEKENKVFHVGIENQEVLESRPFEGTGDVFGGSGNIHRLLAPDYIWFQIDPSQVWSFDGVHMFEDYEAVYEVNIEALKNIGARVTNYYFSCWADEENALYDLLKRFKELGVETLEEFMQVDPDFIFWNSNREGILTGRGFRNRKKEAAFYKEAYETGAYKDRIEKEKKLAGKSFVELFKLDTSDKMDRLESQMDQPEPYTPRNAFEVHRCKIKHIDELESLWQEVKDNWIFQNTDPFDAEKFPVHQEWSKVIPHFILIPGPIPVKKPK